jgi:hypothetical protein
VGWNAATGAPGTYVANTAGLYASTVSNFVRARMNATRIQCVFNNSLNVNATVNVAYFQKPPDSANNSLPLGSALSSAYFNTT